MMPAISVPSWLGSKEEVEEEGFGDETVECQLSINRTTDGFVYPLSPERKQLDLSL